MAISPEQQKTINAVRFALRANGISAAAQAAFRQQAAQIFSPARDTSQATDTKSKEPDRVKLTRDQIKAGEYGELIDNIKKDPRFAELFKGKAPDPASIEKAMRSAGGDTQPAAAAIARPYRLKIGNQVQSFQVVDGKWKQIDSDHWVKTRQAQVVRDAPTYLLSTLNATKKKVDAQRAAGNLTDSRRFRGNVLNNSATPSQPAATTNQAQSAPGQVAPEGARVNTQKGAFVKTAKGWANASTNQIVAGAYPQYLNKQYFASLAKFATKESREPFVIDLRARTAIPLSEWNFGKLFKKSPQATTSPTQAGITKPVTLKQPTPSPVTTPTQQAKPATVSQAPATQPFTMQVDINGQNVKVTKVEPSAKAPSGWYYWHPQYKTWVYPPKDSKDAKIFDQYYAAKTMRESSQQEIDTHSKDLMAARQAEQQGDKATQYEKLADYHEKFSKVNKLKPADRVHHTTQAGIYRNAAQAVRSAQETLNKSSK